MVAAVMVMGFGSVPFDRGKTCNEYSDESQADLDFGKGNLETRGTTVFL